MIEFKCEACGTINRVPEGAAGSAKECSACGVLNRVPQGGTRERPLRPTLETADSARGIAEVLEGLDVGIESHHDERPELILAALQDVSQEPVPALIELLKDPTVSSRLRLKAAWALRCAGKDSLEASLALSMTAESREAPLEVREAAIRSLASMDEAAARLLFGRILANAQDEPLHATIVGIIGPSAARTLRAASMPKATPRQKIIVGSVACVVCMLGLVISVHADWAGWVFFGFGALLSGALLLHLLLNLLIGMGGRHHG
jgi:hypothetical protein